MPRGEGKKKQDSNKPKRPASGYMMFANEHRAEIKAKFPGLKVTEQSVKLGDMWKALDPEKKKEYESRAAAAMIEYKKEAAKYREEHGDSDSEGKKKGKRSMKEKDPNAPKRPTTAFMQYANAVREQVKKENPDARPAEVVRLIGAKWKDLTAEEKKPYEELANKEKERYRQEMAAYKKQGGGSKPKKAKKEEEKKEKKKKKKEESEEEEEEEEENSDNEEDEEEGSDEASE